MTSSWCELLTTEHVVNQEINIPWRKYINNDFCLTTSIKFGDVRRDREPSKLQICKKIKLIKMFWKSIRSSRNAMSFILHIILKNFLSFDCGVYLATRLCRSRPVGKNKKKCLFILLLHDKVKVILYSCGRWDT